MREVVLVPIKPFDVAKSRLRDAMTDAEIETLIRSLARAVIAAVAPRECWVLCEDDGVAAFAHDNGARVLRVASRGLNDAIADGYEEASSSSDVIVVAHADLARPSGLGSFAFADGVTIVTDRHGTGTNVLAVPSGLDITFRFGADSARAHEAECSRLGLAPTVITDSPWALDIDEPADLEYLPQT